MVFEKKTRKIGRSAITLGLSSATIAGLGRAGAPASVTGPLQSSLGTAGSLLGVTVTAGLGSSVLKKVRKLNKPKNRRKFPY